MQQILTQQPASVCQSTSLRPQVRGERLIAAAPRRGNRGAVWRTNSFGAAMGSLDLDSSASAMSQVASAVGIALAAAWAGRELLLDQERAEKEQKGPECPTCGGTGYTECVCARWSDGDMGCSSCRGSGKMQCRSCGGGGRGIPIRATIVAKRPPSSFNG